MPNTHYTIEDIMEKKQTGRQYNMLADKIVDMLKILETVDGYKKRRINLGRWMGRKADRKARRQTERQEDRKTERKAGRHRKAGRQTERQEDR